MARIRSPPQRDNRSATPVARSQVLGNTGTSGVYTLQNVNSGKCLDVENGRTNDFAAVDQYSCYAGPVQQWRLAA
ncbi:ricin-type beta-trefoil lectin protein [Kutzneria buriramensis]|uniref:Ricin-type beta-trefoil lectin protein n=1 Tax=Kutzneria buriramensis TaxID=1045776 RepID=A0A3E0H7R6_9PSEU|nr:ricin-type beta-trefoil lectin protein [Kutzneria buriramensis]